MKTTKDRNDSKDIDATASTMLSSSSSLNDEIFSVGEEEIDNHHDALELIDPASRNVSIDTGKKKMLTKAEGTTSKYFNRNSNTKTNTRYAARKRKETPKSSQTMSSISSLPSIYNNFDATVHIHDHTGIFLKGDCRFQDGQKKQPVPSTDASGTTTIQHTNISIPTITDSNKARKRTNRSTPSSSSSVFYSKTCSMSPPTTGNQDSVHWKCTDLMDKVLLELQITGHECFGKVFDDGDLNDLSTDTEETFGGWGHEPRFA